MFSRVLYADERTSLHLNWMGFGALMAINKHGEKKIAVPAQKSFFIAVAYALQQQGVAIRPDSAECMHIFKVFTEALENEPPGSLMWRTILSQNPDTVVREMLQELRQ